MSRMIKAIQFPINTRKIYSWTSTHKTRQCNYINWIENRKSKKKIARRNAAMANILIKYLNIRDFFLNFLLIDRWGLLAFCMEKRKTIFAWQVFRLLPHQNWKINEIISMEMGNFPKISIKIFPVKASLSNIINEEEVRFWFMRGKYIWKLCKYLFN